MLSIKQPFVRYEILIITVVSLWVTLVVYSRRQLRELLED